MPELHPRRIQLVREETYHEGGPRQSKPLIKAAVTCVIDNPFAGEYHENIAPFMDELKPLGLQMAGRLIEVMGGKSQVAGFGKGAIVGSAGEIEHGALWHVPGGYAMRELLDDSKAIVPSTKKVGAAGARLDVPLTHINASYVRSHFDAMEVGMNDSPKAHELLLVLVMSSGARIHDRVGGLAASEIQGQDGLR